MSERTRPPWRAFGVCIYSLSTGKYVFAVENSTLTREEQDELPALIVQAVNAHDDLLAACEMLMQWQYRCKYCLPGEDCELHTKARAAIAKAKPAQ